MTEGVQWLVSVAYKKAHASELRWATDIYTSKPLNIDICVPRKYQIVLAAKVFYLQEAGTNRRKVVPPSLPPSIFPSLFHILSTSLLLILTIFGSLCFSHITLSFVALKSIS